MFGRRYELFKLFGIAIRVDLSWFVVLALITWSLANGWFPESHPGLEASTYLWMGLFGALGLFVSVVLHELAHALVARRYGLAINGITLFIFGGVAEMRDEPPSPKVEFRVAIVGPIASILIGAVCFLAAGLGVLPAVAGPIVEYLATINLVLAAFNLLPAFPLDGGRVLRSVLWGWKGSLRRATRITSAIGAGFGTVLIVLGIVSLLWGQQLIGGLWWVLIGMFLRQAAQASYQQLLLRHALEGEPVSRFMATHVVAVPRSLSVRELVEKYFLEHHHKMFPVVDDGRLVGCVTTQEIKPLARDEWERQSVGAVMQKCGRDNSIEPEADAMDALGRMSRTGTSRLMVVASDELVGIVSLKDLLEFFALKVELDEKGNW
ncbi:MAG: site-2 protease family protein [Thermoanaerobaculia bacterium]|nr:site-2 protease family protein [Thermoanaerobaculia bacterium]